MAYAHHLLARVHMEHVDGKAHKVGVNGLAWDDEQAFPWGKPLAADQASQPRPEGIRHLPARNQGLLTGQIDNS